MNEQDANLLLQEMRHVKMLLFLQLLSDGVKQKQIASMLKISEATMSRLLPKGIAKNFERSEFTQSTSS